MTEDRYKLIIENVNSTVVTAYKPQPRQSTSYQSEAELLTIGVKDRRMPVERVQYGISTIDSIDDFFASKNNSSTKKASHKK